tara:strand:- start:373 stop:765 length:393 start_codon:yes stop_codon:yes gene_type:complete
MAMVFISHDLGAVGAICDRVHVMYAGRIVESGAIGPMFDAPRHPYTRGLFDAIPRLDGARNRLIPIHGTVPDPSHMPPGCAFAPRCAKAQAFCHSDAPALMPQPDDRQLACFYPVSTNATGVAADERLPA